MKKTIIVIAMVMLSGTLFSQTEQVKVTIENIKTSKGGDVIISLFKKDGFLERGKEVTSKKIKVQKKTMEVQLDEIQVGAYAISVFQDIDSNGKLNTNFVGKPTEPNGFSNNAKGKFGPPDFSDASFKVEKNELTTLVVKLE